MKKIWPWFGIRFFSIKPKILSLNIAMLFIIGVGNSLPDTDPKELTLQFMPQETTGASSPNIHSGYPNRPFSLDFQDGRPSIYFNTVGNLSDNQDRPISLIPTNNIISFASDVFQTLAIQWGFSIQNKAHHSLAIILTQFFVTENDQAVGSMYVGEVRINFQLKNQEEKVLAEGFAAGDARRYGKSRNLINCNEVLSDAMKEAFANLFDHPDLIQELSSVEPIKENTENNLSPSALLTELMKLRSEGFTSEILVTYIEQKTLSVPLTAQDLSDWKKAEFSEEIIMSVLKLKTIKNQRGN